MLGIHVIFFQGILACNFEGKTNLWLKAWMQLRDHTLEELSKANPKRKKHWQKLRGKFWCSSLRETEITQLGKRVGV